MINKLPEQLRIIAEYIDDYNFPLGSKVDLIYAAKELEKFQEVKKELKKLLENDDETSRIKLIHLIRD